MDTDKLSQGALIAAAAGALLLISSFLPWFGVDGGGPSFSLWEAEGSFDVVVALVALVALVPAITVMTGGAGNLPFGLPPGGTNAMLGGITAIGILTHLLIGTNGVGTKIGLFIGLIAAAGIAYGGFVESQDEVAAG